MPKLCQLSELFFVWKPPILSYENRRQINLEGVNSRVENCKKWGVSGLLEIRVVALTCCRAAPTRSAPRPPQGKKERDSVERRDGDGTTRRCLVGEQSVYPVSFPKVKCFFEFTQKWGKMLHNNYNKKWYSSHPLTFCSITFFHKINIKENLFIRPCNFSAFFLLRNLLFPLPLRRKNYMVLWTNFL